MTKITAERYHDISCGHRVVGHEGKCRHLHGHNYRIWFYCEAKALDSVGRVVDFSVIKSSLCAWLEDSWDHKMLIWEKDPALWALKGLARSDREIEAAIDGVVTVPFNPTAENMAIYLLETIGPLLLDGLAFRLVKVTVDETRKCSASAELK